MEDIPISKMTAGRLRAELFSAITANRILLDRDKQLQAQVEQAEAEIKTVRKVFMLLDEKTLVVGINGLFAKLETENVSLKEALELISNLGCINCPLKNNGCQHGDVSCEGLVAEAALNQKGGG